MATTHLGMSHAGAKRAAGIGVVLALIGALVLVFSWSSASSADEYPQVFEIGQDDPRSLTCDDIGALLVDKGVLATAPSWASLKIEDPTDTTASEGGLTVTLSNVTDTTFDWTSDPAIDLVYVKSGSQGSRLYLYDPPTEATAGTGLGTPQQISHVTFCWDDGGGTTTTTAETTTTTAETTTTTVETTTTTVETTTTTAETTTTTAETTTTTGGSTSTTEEPTTTTTEEPTTTTTEASTTTTEASTTTTGGVAGESTTVVPSTSTTVVPAVLSEVAEEGELPRTGLAVGGLLVVAGLLVAAGGGLSMAGHRRDRQAPPAS